MTELESKINEIISESSAESKSSKALSSVKKILNCLPDGGGYLGAAKGLAGFIPDKKADLDLRISQVVETYPLSVDKNDLFELLQFLWNNISAKKPIYGPKTIQSMTTLHEKTYKTLKKIADKNDPIMKSASLFTRKKRFGLF